MGSMLDLDGSAARRRKEMDDFKDQAIQKGVDAALAKDAPPEMPDATDDAIAKARESERRRQLAMLGRQSTFLTGARGAPRSTFGG